MRHFKRRISLSRVAFVIPEKGINAMLSVKGGRPLVNVILSMMEALGGSKTRNWARVIVLALRKINLLYVQMGAPGVIKYLYTCSVCLQQSIGGHVVPDISAVKGIRVSRTDGGLPRIIPAGHRVAIRKDSFLTIRFWMTIFAIYRVIVIPSVAKLESITQPGPQWEEMKYSHLYGKWLNAFKRAFVGRYREVLKAPNPYPIYKASPNSVGRLFEVSTSIHALYRSAVAWYHENNDKVVNAFLQLSLSDKFEKIRVSPILYERRAHRLKESYATLSESLIASLEMLHLHIDEPDKVFGRDELTDRSSQYRYIGKLGLKQEAAGKMRVFAMVDPWTQWLLRPLHDELFKILSRHKMDGTFNQLRPLGRIPWGDRNLFSFDLSSATDRLPISLQVKIIASLYGDGFAEDWKTLLVGREYYLRMEDPRTGKKVRHSLRYAVGQPMGALSSWAMLALTHHYIVHVCAWAAGAVPVGKKFTEYAVLGDDILIWHPGVASWYQRIMSDLGVKIGLAKSLISPLGTAVEFAKRTLYKGVDVSPIPLKELSSAHWSLGAAVEFGRKYRLNHLQLLRLLGYGFRVSYNPDHPERSGNAVARYLALSGIYPKDYSSMLDFFKIESSLLEAEADSALNESDRYRELLNVLFTVLDTTQRRAEKLMAQLKFSGLTVWDYSQYLPAKVEPDVWMYHTIYTPFRDRMHRDLDQIVVETSCLLDFLGILGKLAGVNLPSGYFLMRVPPFYKTFLRRCGWVETGSFDHWGPPNGAIGGSLPVLIGEVIRLDKWLSQLQPMALVHIKRGEARPEKAYVDPRLVEAYDRWLSIYEKVQSQSPLVTKINNETIINL